MIKPVGSKVAILLDAPETQTPEGIYLPETTKKNRISKGKVVAVGRGVSGPNGDIFPLTVQVGDSVYFNFLASREVKDGSETYWIVEESEIVGIIEE